MTPVHFYKMEIREDNSLVTTKHGNYCCLLFLVRAKQILSNQMLNC